MYCDNDMSKDNYCYFKLTSNNFFFILNSLLTKTSTYREWSHFPGVIHYVVLSRLRSEFDRFSNVWLIYISCRGSFDLIYVKTSNHILLRWQLVSAFVMSFRYCANSNTQLVLKYEIKGQCDTRCQLCLDVVTSTSCY